MIEPVVITIPQPRFEALSPVPTTFHLILEPDSTRAGEPNIGYENPSQDGFKELIHMRLEYGSNYHLCCYAKTGDRLLCCFLFHHDAEYRWGHWREVKEVPEFESLS
jgi:hypothetical protein